MTVQLYHGDCLEILPTLPDKSVDAIITDLPYGTTACKWDVIIPLDRMWEQVKRICKGAFVTTASQPFTSVLIMSNLDWFKYEWVWEKTLATGFVHAKNKPLKSHENIAVFSGGTTVHASQSTRRMIYNPQKEIGERYTKKSYHPKESHLHAPSKVNLDYVGTVSVNGGERYPKNSNQDRKR